jgi:hypothetical protein
VNQRPYKSDNKADQELANKQQQYPADGRADDAPHRLDLRSMRLFALKAIKRVIKALNFLVRGFDHVARG